MGFSVSATVAILFAAILIAFGMFYSAAFDAAERTTEARDAARDDALVRENTAINVTAALYYGSNDSLVVHIENTGTTTLSIPDTDVIVDNTLRTGATTSVAGIQGTDLWQPDETARFEYNDTFVTQPGRVKVVAGPGIADGEVVTSG